MWSCAALTASWLMLSYDAFEEMDSWIGPELHKDAPHLSGSVFESAVPRLRAVDSDVLRNDEIKGRITVDWLPAGPR